MPFMVTVVSPRVNGSGGPASAEVADPERFAPYSEAIDRGARELPPVGSAAPTKALDAVTGASPISNPLGADDPPPVESLKASTAARPSTATSLAGTIAETWF